MDEIKSLLPEKKSVLFAKRFPDVDKAQFITIPLAERIVVELQPTEETSDEICFRDDDNGNEHHLVADIASDGIEIHGEAIVNGDIEDRGFVLIDHPEKFRKHYGVYKPDSIMRLLAKWGEEGNATLDIIKSKIQAE